MHPKRALKALSLRLHFFGEAFWSGSSRLAKAFSAGTVIFGGAAIRIFDLPLATGIAIVALATLLATIDGAYGLRERAAAAPASDQTVYAKLDAIVEDGESRLAGIEAEIEDAMTANSIMGQWETAAEQIIVAAAPEYLILWNASRTYGPQVDLFPMPPPEGMTYEEAQRAAVLENFPFRIRVVRDITERIKAREGGLLSRRVERAAETRDLMYRANQGCRRLTERKASDQTAQTYLEWVRQFLDASLPASLVDRVFSDEGMAEYGQEEHATLSHDEWVNVNRRAQRLLEVQFKVDESLVKTSFDPAEWRGREPASTPE